MMKTSIFLALLGLAVAKVDYTGYKVFRAHPTSAQFETILTLKEKYDLDIWSDFRYEGDFIDFMVSPTLQPIVEKTMSRFNIAYETFIEDVEEAARAQLPKQPYATDLLTEYKTYDEINAWMDSFYADNSNLVENLTSETLSYENREIKYLKIGVPGVNKKAFFMTCGIHSREWISPAVCMNVANMYVNEYYASNSQVVNILTEVDIYIVPVSNPDGYEYTWNTDRMWRKTRKTNLPCITNCDGVDPNRNYDNHWAGQGSSGSCCSDSYHGPAAFSENETKIQKELVESIPNVEGYIDIHAYSQMWMFPYGWTKVPSPDAALLTELGSDSVAAIKAVHGQDYVSGSIASTIYVASGSSADYFYQNLQIKCSFAAELRDTGTFGFVLPPRFIVPTSEETFAGLNVIAQAIADGRCE